MCVLGIIGYGRCLDSYGNRGRKREILKSEIILWELEGYLGYDGRIEN